MNGTEAEADPLDDQAYLAQVMGEIEAEVRRRRSSGDLPPRLERELDELFLAHSPVAGRGGAIGDALRMVDSAAYVDPVVPVASDRSGGAFIKKSLRSMNFWYIGWVTQQVNQFATATSRALHLIDEAVTDLRRQLDAQRPPASVIVELAGRQRADAWWVGPVTERLGGPGRVLHAAAGDGWLVAHLRRAGLDAYGVDPRPHGVERVVRSDDGRELDLREEGLLDHLEAVEEAALSAAVLSGVVDGMAHGERARLLDLLVDRLAPDGLLAVHSLSASGWDSAEAPPECDLAPGHPLRPSTWVHLLDSLGFEAEATSAPDGRDYLVLAVLRRPPVR